MGGKTISKGLELFDLIELLEMYVAVYMPATENSEICLIINVHMTAKVKAVAVFVLQPQGH